MFKFLKKIFAKKPAQVITVTVPGIYTDEAKEAQTNVCYLSTINLNAISDGIETVTINRPVIIESPNGVSAELHEVVSTLTTSNES